MKCAYRMAGNVICDTPIAKDPQSPSGYTHTEGRGWCHWASPVAYGPQHSNAVVRPTPPKDAAVTKHPRVKHGWRLTLSLQRTVLQRTTETDPDLKWKQISETEWRAMTWPTVHDEAEAEFQYEAARSSVERHRTLPTKNRSTKVRFRTHSGRRVAFKAVRT